MCFCIHLKTIVTASSAHITENAIPSLVSLTPYHVSAGAYIQDTSIITNDLHCVKQTNPSLSDQSIHASRCHGLGARVLFGYNGYPEYISAINGSSNEMVNKKSKNSTKNRKLKR